MGKAKIISIIVVTILSVTTIAGISDIFKGINGSVFADTALDWDSKDAETDTWDSVRDWRSTDDTVYTTETIYDNGEEFDGHRLYEFNGIKYYIEDDEAVIVFLNWENIVPSELGGYPVTRTIDCSFDPNIFYSSLNKAYGYNGICHNNSVHTYTIVLPDTMTYIGDYAFFCSSINHITLPQNLQKIGDYAFSQCWLLSTIDIPASVQYIGENAFEDCVGDDTGLTTITLHKGLKAVGDYAFYNTNKLEYVYFYGTEDDWNEINFGHFNDYLLKAKRIYCNPVEINASDISVPQGKRQTTVNISLDGISAAGINAAKFNVKVTGDAIIKRVEKSPSFEGRMKHSDLWYDVNSVDLTFTPDSGEISSSFKTLVKLTIELPDDTDAGDEFQIIITPDNNTNYFTDSNGFNFGAISQNATIVITEKIFIIGDVTGDGKLNAKDVVFIMKEMVSSPGFDNPDADFNGDGKINAKDVIALMKAIVSDS